MKNIGKKERKLKQTMKFGRIGVSFLVAIISFLFISNNVSALTSYDFPNIEPLEGFERYAVISTNYNYNSGGTSTTGEPNYYLLYFNQNFTYDGNSSRELLWPDNTNLSSVNLLLYSISNNSWQPLITNLVYFAFPGAYSAASYDTNVVYSNFDIYYKDSDEIYFKKSDELPTYNNEYNFDKNITKLYGIDYMISRDDEISDNIQISFKYNGENKPSFNGIVTYALKNYGEELSNELYGWTNGPGYSSIEDTGLSYGYYTETYEDNIYTLTISDVVIKNSEFKKIIVRFEFLWATDVSNILVKSNNLYSDSFRINSFGYDYIIDNFNTVYFSYINFSTTLEEYRGTFYLIDTLKDNGNYRIFPDYYSTDSLEFTDYIIPTDIYTNHYGYENITQFNAYIGTEIKTGFWLTHNFSEGRSAYYPFVPDTTTYDFEFLVAYKMNENLYFSTNMSEDNENAIITVELNENNEPNVIVTDIEISSDVVTSSDYKSFFTIIRDYLNDLKETREYINELYNYFYYSLPRYLKVLHDLIIIFICFIFFIKVGVEQ